MADNRRFIELIKAGFEPISDNDLVVANYVISLLPAGINDVNVINPNKDFKRTFKRATSSFNMYDEEVKRRVIYERTNAKYFQAEVYHPYVFEIKFLTDQDLKPLITIPQTVDYISDVYLGHEFHHVLKDTNPEESKIKYRFSEVIPMFYELVRADREAIEIVKKEIINRRIALLQFDLMAIKNNPLEYEKKLDKGLKYYNSFYYSLLFCSARQAVCIFVYIIVEIPYLPKHIVYLTALIEIEHLARCALLGAVGEPYISLLLVDINALDIDYLAVLVAHDIHAGL